MAPSGFPPEVVASAGGRLQFLGDHTDYNLGLVLASSAVQRITATFRKRADNLVRIASREFGKAPELVGPDLNHCTRQGLWFDPVVGALKSVAKNAPVTGGLEVWISSEIPVGAGMSSSAALILAVAAGFNQVLGREPLSSEELCETVVWVDHEFLQVPTGILDQVSIVKGRENHLLLLDCRSREIEHVAVDLKGYRLAVFDSKITHNLAITEGYRTRVAECREAAQLLGRFYNSRLSTLRDVDAESHRLGILALPPILRSRVEHILGENRRVRAGFAALKQCDLVKFGSILNQTHASCRDLYDNTCEEINFLQETLASASGVLGAKLMGAGWGGVVLALIAEADFHKVQHRVSMEFMKRFGGTINCHETLPGSTLVVKAL